MATLGYNQRQDEEPSIPAEPGKLEVTASGPGLMSWFHQTLHPGGLPSPVLALDQAPVSGLDLPSSGDIRSSCKSPQSALLIALFKISYTFDLVEFAPMSRREENVTEKGEGEGRENNKATLSASFDLKTVSLL